MAKLKGVVPPMITPFGEDGAIDFKALISLVEFLSGHVDGLFVTGSYGSGPLMSTEERKAVTSEAVRAAAGRIPIITMVGAASTLETVELARHAESAGAAAVAAVGPYYFKHDREALTRFFGSLVDAVHIPAYVYNNPRFQGYPMAHDTIAALKERGVYGVKDATFDILVHADYQRSFAPDGFDVVLGTEAMWLSARVLGCEAFIPGLGNAFPELCRRLFREGMEGDFHSCRTTQFLVNELREILALAPSTQSAVYAMLELRGIIAAGPRGPVLAATELEKRAIREALHRLNLL